MTNLYCGCIEERGYNFAAVAFDHAAEVMDALIDIEDFLVWFPASDTISKRN
jgi:hypothetical protein